MSKKIIFYNAIKEGFCVCGEKTCFKDCKVCDILLNDKLNLDTQAIIISIIFMRYITKR